MPIHDSWWWICILCGFHLGSLVSIPCVALPAGKLRRGVGRDEARGNVEKMYGSFRSA